MSQTVAKQASDMWATFRLDGETLALRVEDVQEVLMAQPLTPVPLAPHHVMGLLNLRGQIVPAIDLRRYLQFTGRPEGAVASLLVVKLHGELLAIVVDEIGDVLELAPGDWRPPPDTLESAHRSWVFAICPTNDGVVLGMRLEVLATDEADAVMAGG